MNNIWKELKKPIFVLAPMEGVTDNVFRELISEIAKPDILFTEFTNVDGIETPAIKVIEKRLSFSKKQHPIIAQIWGLNPHNFYLAAKKIKKMGFDGIDINMGCPDRVVVKKGACGGLIKNPTLAKEIIIATRKGAAGLPVSVKTRIGFSVDEAEVWIKFLLEQELDALIIHGRTIKELSSVPAHWEEIGKAVKIRKELGVDTIIIGNGDVKSISEGVEKVKMYGVDGVMLGRAIFHNPWLFDSKKSIETISQGEKLSLLLRHIDLYEEIRGDGRPFDMLKKYFKIYVNEFKGATRVRENLMEAKTISEVREIVANINS